MDAPRDSQPSIPPLQAGSALQAPMPTTQLPISLPTNVKASKKQNKDTETIVSVSEGDAMPLSGHQAAQSETDEFVPLQRYRLFSRAAW